VVAEKNRLELKPRYGVPETLNIADCPWVTTSVSCAIAIVK
jgi:hypothetical protein